MTRFDWCVDRILDAEGGSAITEDPDDPGGLTKYGISARSHPTVDIRNLTREAAIEIYRIEYWQNAACELFPVPLDYYLFDAAVNQGVKRAVMTMQRMLHVPIDGWPGNITVHAAWQHRSEEFCAQFLTLRAMQYMASPNFKKYGEGWLTRLFKVAAARQ